MAIPPYVGLSVSILNNNQSNYPYCGREESDSSGSESKKQTYENETIRSAFKKVGIGFSKLSESRSPSPIDPIRTPSPYDRERKGIPEIPKQKKEAKPKEEYPFGPSQRPRFQSYQKEMEKAPIFLGGNLIGPVGLNRQNFIPAPIFGTNPILPTSFVTASLLPPSLAALTLPAQNVCAKCNVSFRMTSDLVYHMRSHHKNDHSGSDQQRRRRELDKLKCPVCNESFRERHHLTRHMTAHQDKEGDNIDSETDLRN
ncbi:UNVERIFIED_CONTAM: hypothetical protein PYX00_000035 [Menopon gallinae]|uniref:C2H2-type domain-containing protein n=1 Tax=Menopon gallinae TaxID=328185 RepID=A0AAW2I8L1_9NEOP